jgi:hypothetical protein
VLQQPKHKNFYTLKAGDSNGLGSLSGMARRYVQAVRFRKENGHNAHKIMEEQ